MVALLFRTFFLFLFALLTQKEARADTQTGLKLAAVWTMGPWKMSMKGSDASQLIILGSGTYITYYNIHILYYVI